MTRPMSEDSPGKQAANYGYRIRQLERRPAPGVSPFTFIHREVDEGLTVSSGGSGATKIHFDTTVNTEATRFAVAGSGDFDIDVTGTGLYLFKLQVHWADTIFTGITAAMIRSSAWTWDKETEWEHPYGASVENAGGPVISFFQRLAGGTSRIEFLVRQNSGGDQTLASASCEIVYLGSFEGEPSDPDVY